MLDRKTRLIVAAMQAFTLSVFTYYTVKWIMDSLDPTKKSRIAAQKQVEISSHFSYDHNFLCLFLFKCGR